MFNQDTIWNKVENNSTYIVIYKSTMIKMVSVELVVVEVVPEMVLMDDSDGGRSDDNDSAIEMMVR